MYANKHAYTIAERARFSGPLWYIADEQDYRPIGSYTHHGLIRRKKRMGINGYRCNQKVSRFNLNHRRTGVHYGILLTSKTTDQ